MKHKKFIDSKRISKIFYGQLRGSHEDFVVNKENKFAYAFLRLTEIVAGQVTPIDEARLESYEDKIEYLKNVENVHASRITLERKWYRKEIGPFIGFFGKNREPVLLQYKHNFYHVLFLDDNTERKVDKKLASQFASDGVYIIAKAGINIKNARHLFWQIALRQKKDCVIFILLTLLATLISSIIPLVARFITNDMIPDAEQKGIFAIAISLILGVLAGLLINIVVNRTRFRMQMKSSQTLTSTILGRIMAISIEEEKKISSRIIALTIPFITSMETMIGSFMGGLIFLIQGLVVWWTTNCVDEGKFSNFVILGEVLYVVLIQIAVYRKTMKVHDSEIKLSTVRREITDNIETIKVSAIEDRMYYRFAIDYDERMRIQHGIDHINQTTSIAGTLISSIGIFFIFLYAAKLHEMDTGRVSAMLTSFVLMVSYLNGMSASFSEVASALPYLKFANLILNTPLEKSNAVGADHKISGRIELNNVSFQYSPDSNQVINNINLTIEPGQYIGIVGNSGCGKTSLMRLMLGFLTPTEGHICYDGIDIGQYNIQTLRRQFGVVLQDAAVISGSIRRNIGLSDDADMKLVEEAAKIAAIHDDIEAMPMKYNTLLSEDAETISGGQRQRIVLARALIRKPKILFLDEATSALDNISQHTIKNNLDQLGITRIVIAHRLSTVMNCDRILVIDHGKIIEEGTYSTLMKKNGLFAKLAR